MLYRIHYERCEHVAGGLEWSTSWWITRDLLMRGCQPQLHGTNIVGTGQRCSLTALERFDMPEEWAFATSAALWFQPLPGNKSQVFFLEDPE